jgi:hypothetical protein
MDTLKCTVCDGTRINRLRLAIDFTKQAQAILVGMDEGFLAKNLDIEISRMESYLSRYNAERKREIAAQR